MKKSTRAAVTAGFAAAGFVLTGLPKGTGRVAMFTGLAGVVLVGMVDSAKTMAVEARFNNFINNGGSVGGPFVVNGDHTVTGNINATNNIGGTGAQFNGGGATLSGGISSGGNIAGGNITASGNMSDAHQSNIGIVVSALPVWLAPSTKCATVTAIGTGHTVDQVEGMCANVIHSLKNAGHMA
jgi:hypothetical protein